MDGAALVDKRRKRYLAQLLEAFEDLVEPQTTDADAVATFKGLVRAKMNALAVDAIETMNLVLSGQEVNGAAIELADRLYPHGRPRARS